MLTSLWKQLITLPQSTTGYAALTRARFNTAPIQAELEKHGYPTTPVNYPTYGGGSYVVYPDGLLVGGEGEGGGSATIGKTANRYAGGGQGFFNVGYVLQSSEQIRIYAICGLGGGGGGVSAGKKHPDNRLRMKKDSIVAMGGGGVRSYFGVGIEFRIGGRLIIGARVGVMFLPPLLYFGNESRIKPFIRFIAGISGGRD